LNGDFDRAYEAAKVLAEAYHEVSLEAAQLRFQVNFGSQRCDRCEGLKAGPDVIATCFQVKRCNFTNVRVGDETPRIQRVLTRLTVID
jgi:hypothetical protein